MTKSMHERSERASQQRLVSVLVPSYRAGHYLAHLIESVLYQTYQRWELLILDDGSGDLDHPNVKSLLADPRIRTYRWFPNRGVSQATRFLMEEAAGKYWCYPGADDLICPEFISSRLALLDHHCEVSIIFGKGSQIDSSGSEIWFDEGRRLMEQISSFEDQVIEPDTMIALLLCTNVINTPSVFARSKPTIPVLTRYNVDWRYCQDWFFWLVLAGNGCRFYYSSRVLHSYRFHEESLTQSAQSWAWRNVEPALVLLTGLAVISHNSEHGLNFFRHYRIELFANWLVRSFRFRNDVLWQKWKNLSSVAQIRWFEWPQVVIMTLLVYQFRRWARSKGMVVHGLPSAWRRLRLMQESSTSCTS